MPKSLTLDRHGYFYFIFVFYYLFNVCILSFVSFFYIRILSLVLCSHFIMFYVCIISFVLCLYFIICFISFILDFINLLISTPVSVIFSKLLDFLAKHSTEGDCSCSSVCAQKYQIIFTNWLSNENNQIQWIKQRVQFRIPRQLKNMTDAWRRPRVCWPKQSDNHNQDCRHLNKGRIIHFWNSAIGTVTEEWQVMWNLLKVLTPKTWNQRKKKKKKKDP